MFFAIFFVALLRKRFSRSSAGGKPTSPTQYAAHSGGKVNPIRVRTIMIEPIVLSAPSSLPVTTMPVCTDLTPAAQEAAAPL
jgi:hypothetical protein